MRRILLLSGLLLAPPIASADVLGMPVAQTEAPAERPAELPARGQTMAQVERRFGKPVQVRGPVGGDRPLHPPITRWDYAGFTVVFERDRVIDVVVPGSPPPLYNTAELKPAE